MHQVSKLKMRFDLRLNILLCHAALFLQRVHIPRKDPHQIFRCRCRCRAARKDRQIIQPPSVRKVEPLCPRGLVDRKFFFQRCALRLRLFCDRFRRCFGLRLRFRLRFFRGGCRRVRFPARELCKRAAGRAYGERQRQNDADCACALLLRQKQNPLLNRRTRQTQSGFFARRLRENRPCVGDALFGLQPRRNGFIASKLCVALGDKSPPARRADSTSRRSHAIVRQSDHRKSRWRRCVSSWRTISSVVSFRSTSSVR